MEEPFRFTWYLILFVVLHYGSKARSAEDALTFLTGHGRSWATHLSAVQAISLTGHSNHATDFETALTNNLGAQSSDSMSSNATWTERLRRASLPTLDRMARPHATDQTTTVTLSLTVRHATLSEKDAMLSVDGYLAMSWNDQRIAWIPSNWGNLSVLHVGASEVWLPDIRLYNSAGGSSEETFGDTHALVRDSGVVLWVPPVHLRVHCDMDLRSWPLDEHECVLTFGSWTYDMTQVDLKEVKEPYGEYESDVQREPIEAGQWSVVSVTGKRAEHHYSCCPEPYVELAYTLRVSRRGTALALAASAPLAAAAVLLVAAALQAPKQRAPPLLAAALTSALYLVHLSNQIPGLTERPPRLVSMYCVVLWASCVAAAAAALVCRIAAARTTPPAYLRKLLSPSTNARDDERQETSESTGGKCSDGSTSGDWSQLAALLDRTLLVVGALVVVVLASVL